MQDSSILRFSAAGGPRVQGPPLSLSHLPQGNVCHSCPPIILPLPSLSFFPSFSPSLFVSLQTELGNGSNCHWLNTVFEGFTNL